MRLRTRLLTSAAVLGTLVAPLVPGAPAGAATPAVDDAVAWLETQQVADGGFDRTSFAGYETPDAIYAIAAGAQTTTTWSTSEALAAIEAISTGGGTPKDPLDAVDDWVDSVQTSGESSVAAKAQQAAKVIVLVTVPLGLDESDFDPSNDTEATVDLLAILEAGAGTGDYSALPFGGRTFAAWALGALGETVPPTLLTGLAAGQKANGGFDFEGDPTGTGFDADITAQVVTGLVVGGMAPTATTIDRAVVALGLRQKWNGEWAGVFDDGSPNSTGVVMLAAAAVGSDPDSPCWRNSGDVRFSGVPYSPPTGALEDRQADDGHIVGPYDDFGVDTFATSQAVQGLAAADGRSRYEAAQACTAVEASGNRRKVHALYVDLLVRLADPGGADYWTAQFDGGMSPALLAQRFTGTPEYAGRVVERLYQEHLGRSAGAGERQGWAGLITSGRRVDLIANILGSPEFYSGTGNPPSAETWAEALVPATLGVPATDGQVDAIVDQLQAGRSRTTIARAILVTAEGRGELVADLYRQLLRRNAFPKERTYWRTELARGVSPERLVTLIAGSPEYLASTQA